MKWNEKHATNNTHEEKTKERTERKRIEPSACGWISSNLYTYACKISFAKQKNKKETLDLVSKSNYFYFFSSYNIETNGRTHTRERESKCQNGGGYNSVYQI